MKWKELYEKNKSRKYREIDEVIKDVILKARVKNIINRYHKLLFITLGIISILLIVTFHSNINVLGLTFSMFILIILLIIYFNTYTISCKDNKITIKMNMQKTEIQYSKLKNIYIEKRQNRIFIKKRDTFLLIILYETPNKNIGNIELPILFLNSKDVEKFLKCFSLKESKNNNIVRARKYQLKRLLIKVSFFILIWIAIIITLIL